MRAGRNDVVLVATRLSDVLLLEHLRNTSVSLMLARGMPPHIVAAWHGHAISLSIYSDAQPDDLKAAGAALFE
ncbi:hypothetical protein OG874_33400 [Nocardia sp. NBC_00565]|uniref:hypothetical protein n=1 Tax=Nocardia sp. NBC_00565 TaxID=2975993 RepID=UPI002E821DE1|nr:hypothetical protein [Nocardia sp. NBC_00565]WUC01645.1 hypothetical protein OG874_33400 [Nocardia sp. NBC_00565]